MKLLKKFKREYLQAVDIVMIYSVFLSIEL
jgi:hypothetical protein